MLPRTTLLGLGVTALALAACSTPTQNFRSETEKFLNDSSAVAGLFDGADVSDAECERPASTDVGTVYTCTAQVVGVGEVGFGALITSETTFEVDLLP